MPQYTTGEMAKLCDVSVRTVQFYDTKDLLKPSELTEGGRRLYTEEDLNKLRMICMLKTLGLSLGSIKGILESDAPDKILLLLLAEQEKEIDGEIREKQKQLQAIQVIRKSIRGASTIPVQSVGDIERMMNSRKKLRKVYAIMMAVGVVMDIIEIAAILLWILKGNWIPFAVGMPVVIVMAVLLVRMYHKNTAYICAECNTVFQPPVREMFFARHTPRTRKLKCPHCGHTGFCLETASEYVK